MPQLFKIAHWNANGLSQHGLEVKTFINQHKIDILLISETHFTIKNYIKINKYTVYDTKHPDGRAHGGSAIIIKSSIKHHELQKYSREFLQATSVSVEDWNGPITISALYCPPKHSIKKTQFIDYYKTLGKRFMAAGDYNAKHTHWGSRTITYKGKQLLMAMEEYGLNSISTGQPTYWPTDRAKTPDLIDFCITKGVAEKYLTVESCFDLSSDHSPVIITMTTNILGTQHVPRLYSKFTNWKKYKTLMDNNLSLNIQLKNAENISNAINNFNRTIIEAAKESTPERGQKDTLDICPTVVKVKIKEKRGLRKIWQRTRSPTDKMKFNRAVKEIKILLHKIKNESIQGYLQNLTATELTDYSLWRATRGLKRPQHHIPPLKMNNGEWAKSNKEKASAFAEHLQNTFVPYPPMITEYENNEIIGFLQTPFQMSCPIKNFTIKEVQHTIYKEINHKKTPGHDMIGGKLLMESTQKGIRFITYIFNAILRTSYFPDQWKTAQIIMIPKPGKDLNLVESYRPISLLPALSKVFEKLFMKRLGPVLMENKLLPNHQFGFRQQHSPIEQVHRVVDKIAKDLESKRYCSVAFLDITQAFDKVWHEGLLYKLKEMLPHHYYQILRAYLTNRKFMVKHHDECTSLAEIYSGVPQGSVLGPVLYLLYTADLPTGNDTMTATFADDTAILASSMDPLIASMKLQNGLNKLQHWLKKWRIKANEGKSVHVTFTTRKDTCPMVKLNGTTLPQDVSARYLGLHLDRRLTWQKHVAIKNKQLRLKFYNMYWLLGRKSQLSLENKVILYKCILKPVWTYGIELWGTTSKSNIEILERFQSKVLRAIVNAPWYVRNSAIQQDLKICSVKETIGTFSKNYYNRLKEHPNILVNNLLFNNNQTRRLKRYRPSDLATRFNV